MFDQTPLANNCVTLDIDKTTGKPNNTDGLGIPRPKVEYGFDPYTMEGFRMAAYVCTKVYEQMGATEFTTNSVGKTGDFTYQRSELSLLRRGSRRRDASHGPRSGYVRRRCKPALTRREKPVGGRQRQLPNRVYRKPDTDAAGAGV